MNGKARTMPIITRNKIATIHPITHVNIAFPVVKSNACLTAITIAANLQIHTVKEIKPPRMGIKLRIDRIPGELEKPIVLRSSLKEATPPKTLVPIMYVIKDQMSHAINDENKPPIRPKPIPPSPCPDNAWLIAVPIPEQTLERMTTKMA